MIIKYQQLHSKYFASLDLSPKSFLQHLVLGRSAIIIDNQSFSPSFTD